MHASAPGVHTAEPAIYARRASRLCRRRYQLHNKYTSAMHALIKPSARGARDPSYTRLRDRRRQGNSGLVGAGMLCRRSVTRPQELGFTAAEIDYYLVRGSSSRARARFRERQLEDCCEREARPACGRDRRVTPRPLYVLLWLICMRPDYMCCGGVL